MPRRSVSIRFLAARHEEALTEGSNEFRVGLAGSQNRGDDASAGAGKNLDQLVHLAADVFGERACVGKVQISFCAACKCIGDESAFVGPPTINRSLADGSTIRDFFDREIGKAIFGKQLQRAAQDRLARLFATRTSRRALSVRGFRVDRFGGALPHRYTVTYNVETRIRIRYDQYRI